MAHVPQCCHRVSLMAACRPARFKAELLCEIYCCSVEMLCLLLWLTQMPIASGLYHHHLLIQRDSSLTIAMGWYDLMRTRSVCQKNPSQGHQWTRSWSIVYKKCSCKVRMYFERRLFLSSLPKLHQTNTNVSSLSCSMSTYNYILISDFR